jgi:hypothetical protein
MLVQPTQFVGVGSCFPMFFTPLFKLGMKLLYPWQDFAIDPDLNARKKVTQGSVKNRCDGESRPERWDTVSFFVARDPTAFIRT